MADKGKPKPGKFTWADEDIEVHPGKDEEPSKPAEPDSPLKRVVRAAQK